MNKTRLALVIPPSAGRGYNDYGIKERLPHIGIGYLAGNIDRETCEARIYDCPVSGISTKALISELKKFNVSIVGLTAMTLKIEDAHQAALSIRAALPEAVILIGGYHVSAVPVETMERYPGFDIAVVGEGERTLVELLAALREGGGAAALEMIQGICFRVDGKPKLTETRPRLDDLDSLSYPAFELMQMDKYGGFYAYARRRTATLSTGRGCPYRGIFCYKITGPKYRKRSVESVMDEVRRDVRDFAAQDLVITDESFLIDKKRIRTFCEAFLAEGIEKKTKWICQSRVDHVDMETLKLMKRAGCRVMSFGIESGNPEILEKICKDISLDRARQAIRMAKEAGILTDTNFIIGHPWETRKTIKETIDFSISLDPDLASFSLMVPFPGTDIADMARRGEGGLKLLSEDYSEYGKQVGNAMELEDIHRAELELWHRTAYKRFFLRPSKILGLFRVASVKTLVYMVLNRISKIIAPRRK